MKNRIDVITLGCSKNLVDSELLMRQLVANGYTVEHDPADPKGEIAVINNPKNVKSIMEYIYEVE